jgi:hypothetical protein
MEKKEFPKAEGDFQPKASGASGRLSGLYAKSFNLIKLILGVCLLPFVYSSTVAFLNEFSLLEKPLQNCFWSGIITLLLVYLFVWEPVVIYAKGYKLLELIFNFFKPLVRVAPYLLPIYTIVVFLFYGLLSLSIKSAWLLEYALFFSGFSVILHLVFSAKALRGRKQDFLKANYIFGFSFIYALNLMLLAFCLNLIFKDFSFVNFFKNAYSMAGSVFKAIISQLFIVKS